MRSEMVAVGQRACEGTAFMWTRSLCGQGHWEGLVFVEIRLSERASIDAKSLLYSEGLYGKVLDQTAIPRRYGL